MVYRIKPLPPIELEFSPQALADPGKYRAVTAVITYWMPDHGNVLQEYIRQDIDTAPKFPNLTKFLEFWERELQGKMHRVRFVDCEFEERPMWDLRRSPHIATFVPHSRPNVQRLRLQGEDLVLMH